LGHLPGAAARVPSLASHKVARVGPVDAERTASSVGVSHAGMAVVPVRVVVAVVEASAGANGLALLHVHDFHVLSGSGQDSSNSGKAGEERCEGDHDVDEPLCLTVVDYVKMSCVIVASLDDFG
jgi:hypothetical protein